MTKRREQKRKWIATRRAERLAAGLCADCGVPVTITEPEKRGRGRPRTGYRCNDCAEKRRRPRAP